jgi:hypothetical protein
LAPDATSEFESALNSLQRIDSATSSGVVWAKYSSLVNDARYRLDRLFELHGRCTKCEKLEEIYDIYSNAGKLWNYRIQEDGDAAVSLLIQIDNRYNKYPYRENNRYRWKQGVDDCRAILWQEAGVRLAEIR